MELISLIILYSKDCFDENTGLWCFKSRFGHEVNSDPFYPSLVLHCKNRNKVASDYLTADDFELQSYCPSGISPAWLCEVEIYVILILLLLLLLSLLIVFN